MWAVLGFISNRNASHFPCPLKDEILKNSFADELSASPRRLNWASIGCKINSTEYKRGMRRRTNKINFRIDTKSNFEDLPR